MKHFTSADIEGLEKIFRANLINSLSGYKPANLIGTISKAGETNLAVFSSVVHLGANPALLGMIVRPATVARHTYENIIETGYYTINHIHESFVEKAHYTSAKFDRSVSEFEACKLTPEFIDTIEAPFVKESKVKMAMRFMQEIPIELNNTILIIGKIEHIFLPEEIIDSSGLVKLGEVKDVCVNGLEAYSSVSMLANFPYAKANQLPLFL